MTEERGTYVTEDTEVQVEEEEHGFFFMVPNMIDSMGLDPYAYRLYGHLKRVAGEKGRSWQSRDTIAKACGMSAGKVSESKEVLEGLGLIRIEEKPGNSGKPLHVIRIVNIWKRNFEWKDVQMSPRDIQTSPRDIKKTTDKKTPLLEPEKSSGSEHAIPEQKAEPKSEEAYKDRILKAAFSGGAPMDHTGMNVLPHISDYPEDVKWVIVKVCQLFKWSPPGKGKKGGPFAQWITDSRELRSACGELDFRRVLDRVHSDWCAQMEANGGIPKWVPTGPGSLIKISRGTAGMMQATVIPDGVEPDPEGGFYV